MTKVKIFNCLWLNSMKGQIPHVKDLASNTSIRTRGLHYQSLRCMDFPNNGKDLVNVLPSHHRCRNHNSDQGIALKEWPSFTYCQYRQFTSNVRNMEKVSPGIEKDSKSDKIETNGSVNKDNVNQDTDTDDEDPGFKAVLSAITPNVPPPNVVEFVPGKGPPPAPPVDCCMSGCANCVWIQYAEELKNYFSVEEGNVRAKEAIEKLDNPGLQMFLKLELGLL